MRAKLAHWADMLDVALFVESGSRGLPGKLTQQITPVSHLENLVNEPTDPTHVNCKLPRTGLLDSQ